MSKKHHLLVRHLYGFELGQMVDLPGLNLHKLELLQCLAVTLQGLLRTAEVSSCIDGLVAGPT